MRIAKRDVSDGNAVAHLRGRRHVDGVVGERRTANSTQGLVSDHELVMNFKALADGKKRLPLALLGALTVADVDGCYFVVARRQSGAYTGVHAATEEDNCA